MSVILGMDVSTSITGYAIISDGELVDSQSVDTRNGYDNLFEKIEPHREEISEIDGDYDIDEIFLEEPLKSFSSGFTSPSTMGKLAKFNGMVSLALLDQFDLAPEYLNVRSARKRIGLTVSQKSDKSGKEQAFEYIDDTEPNFEYQLTYADNPKPESKDRADAIVIARAGEQILKEKDE